MMTNNGMTQFKVLVVEDAAIAARMAKLFFEAKNCWVDWVETGEDAIKKLDASYDLVLLDFGLPGIDGIETAKRIRNSENSVSSIPIVVFTAHEDDQEKIDEAIATGVNEVCAKPLTPDKCDMLLKQFLPTTALPI